MTQSVRASAFISSTIAGSGWQRKRRGVEEVKLPPVEQELTVQAARSSAARCGGGHSTQGCGSVGGLGGGGMHIAEDKGERTLQNSCCKNKERGSVGELDSQKEDVLCHL